MKPEELFKKEFESLCGSDATTFIGESIRKALKGIDLESNKYFYLYAEQKMDDPEWKEYGDCNEDAGKSWTYHVPVYNLTGDGIETEDFQGLEHFDKKKLTGYCYWDEQQEDWMDADFTEEQKAIIQFLDQGSTDYLEDMRNYTGDPYRDNGVRRSDFY